MGLRQFEDLGWGLGKKSEDVAFLRGEGGGGCDTPIDTIDTMLGVLIKLYHENNLLHMSIIHMSI